MPEWLDQLSPLVGVKQSAHHTQAGSPRTRGTQPRTQRLGPVSLSPCSFIRPQSAVHTTHQGRGPRSLDAGLGARRGPTETYRKVRRKEPEESGAQAPRCNDALRQDPRPIKLLAIIAWGSHPFPSRTRPLSPTARMVLLRQLGGRVRHRQLLQGPPEPSRSGGLLASCRRVGNRPWSSIDVCYVISLISSRWPSGSRKKQRISPPRSAGGVRNSAPRVRNTSYAARQSGTRMVSW